VDLISQIHSLTQTNNHGNIKREDVVIADITPHLHSSSCLEVKCYVLCIFFSRVSIFDVSSAYENKQLAFGKSLFQKLLVKLNNYALHRSRPRQL
jgi:hypothetical protein